MQCRFSFKHMESSQALADYAKEKIVSKVERFATKPIEAHVTFEVDSNQHHVHVNVHGGDGFNIQIDATSIDMYASIDLMIDKLEARLKKQKEKLKDHKTTKHLTDLEFIEPTDKEDCDSVPVDAADVIKLEKVKNK